MQIEVVLHAVAVHQGFRSLRGNVLVQSATKRHIDHLHAAAYAQHWFASCYKRFNQLLFVSISHTVACPSWVHHFFAVAAWPHIAAAHEHHAIQPLGIVGNLHITHLGLAFGGRNHDRQVALRHDPMHHRLLNVLKRLALEDHAFVVRVKEASRDANFQTFGIRRHDDLIQHYMAALNSFSKSADVQGRGLV